MIDTGLKGKVALITGGNNPMGIGAATAKAFAREGAKVFINYLRVSPEKFGISVDEAQKATEPGRALYRALTMKSADEVLQAIRKEGGQAEAWEADLADPANIPLIFDHAEAAFGPVDVLVNNATHWEEPRDTIFNTSAGVLDRYFAVNTRATVLMMKEFVARHKERGRKWGRIINLSQCCAQVAGHLSYSSTKAPIEMLTRAVVSRVGPLGIAVNTVAPGPVQTGYISAENEKKESARLPLRRVGRPEDLAEAIVFLASDQASWITGQRIKVDGGCGYELK